MASGPKRKFGLSKARTTRVRTAPAASVRVASPWLSFDLDFVGCPKVPVALASILRGWDLTTGPVRPASRDKIEFRWSGRKLLWHSATKPVPKSWIDLPPATVFDAVCDIHYEMSDWFLAERPGHLGLHAAAIEFGKGLVVFPSTIKAGKSVLTIAAAAAGLRIFGDDVLAVHPKTHDGVALGMLPRLRLPLPASLSSSFHAFLAARRGNSNKRHHYVDLKDHELAPLGTTAPIAGFVLLDRKENGRATLGSVSHGEMLKCAISRNFASDVLGAAEIFSKAEKLTAKAGRFRLTYADCDDAIEHLAGKFGWPKSAAPLSKRSPALRRPSRDSKSAEPGRKRAAPVPENTLAHAQDTDSEKPLVQSPRIKLRRMGADNFLIDPESDAIHHLNELGAAVWQLFAVARRPAETVALVQAAFPGVPETKIRSDLEHLIAGMLHSGVLRARRRR